MVGCFVLETRKWRILSLLKRFIIFGKEAVVRENPSGCRISISALFEFSFEGSDKVSILWN